MHRKVAVLGLLAAASLCAQATVIVTGRITDAVTGLPIEEASITLDQGSYHELLFTDTSGNFVFDEVPTGTATVKIRKAAYLPFETTSQDDTSIEITPDRHDYKFKLAPAGKIRGRVTGEGKPGEAIGVSLLKEDYSVGFRQYIPYAQFNGAVGPDGSFQINGLEPGRYLVKATPEINGGTARELVCLMHNETHLCATVDSEVPDAPKEPDEGYAVTWYPGTTVFADAAPINLSAGEMQTADFRIAQQPLFHISGKVTLPEFQTGITTLALYGNGQGVALVLASDGEFRFRGLPPGQYSARAIVPPKQQIRRDITVTDHDVEGLTLVPEPELHLNGQFVMANADEKPPSNLDLRFGPALPADSTSVEVAGNGTFVLSGFPDDYSMQPVVPTGYAVTEIRYAGINYLNSLIPIHGNAADPTITIILSNQPATVGGVVDGDSKSEAKVVLTPWPLPENFDIRSLRVATTDKQGAFAFHGLPPGKYKAAVLTGEDRRRDHDLTILNDKFSAADVFELTAGQSATITPKQ